MPVQFSQVKFVSIKSILQQFLLLNHLTHFLKNLLRWVISLSFNPHFNGSVQLTVHTGIAANFRLNVVCSQTASLTSRKYWTKCNHDIYSFIFNLPE